MADEHEIRSIECECGFEGRPEDHDTWVWEQAHPVQGPITQQQHVMNEMMRPIYDTMVRQSLLMDVATKELGRGPITFEVIR
jgi:hypothetical protein